MKEMNNILKLPPICHLYLLLLSHIKLLIALVFAFRYWSAFKMKFKSLNLWLYVKINLRALLCGYVQATCKKWFLEYVAISYETEATVRFTAINITSEVYIFIRDCQ